MIGKFFVTNPEDFMQRQYWDAEKRLRTKVAKG